MPHDSNSEQEPDDSDADPEFVEVDPSGRYGRYKEALGKGAFKKVYRAFDELEGIEVAWNQVKVADLLRNSVDLERLYSEVHLLKTLKHKNIIKFYNSWIDVKNENINFITEVFTSGTLRQYRKKHKHVDLRAVKKWSRQILEGLCYLHGHDPPVIHRDLKCDNLFVNGNQGEVKIGDLGLAAILHQARSAHSVIGTPEFMAPELYEENYNELVDIYAFGMCLLELVTFEYPYVECTNAAQIFKKVTAGIKPASLSKVKDPDVKAFIEKCIAEVSARLSAKDLLEHPFLQSDNEVVTSGQSLHHSGQHSDGSDDHIVNHGDSILESGKDFTVEGQRTDLNTIFLKLRIADSTGNIRNIHFPFDIEEDTATAVASEMVEELHLTDHDVSVIAEMINSEIRIYITDWEPREHVDTVIVGELSTSESGTPGALDDTPHTIHSPHLGLILERLPSGRRYWCDSPKEGDGISPHRLGPSTLSPHTNSSTPRESLNDESEQSSDYHDDESNLLDTGSPQLTQNLIYGSEFKKTIAASKSDIGSDDILSDQKSSKGSPKVEEANDHDSSLDTGSGDISRDPCSLKGSPKIEETDGHASKLDTGFVDISRDQYLLEGSPKIEETNEQASKLDIGSDEISSDKNSLKGSPKMEETKEHASSLNLGSGDISSDQCSSKGSPKIEETNEHASKLDIISVDISSHENTSNESPKMEETNEHASTLDIGYGDISRDQCSSKGSPKIEDTNENASKLNIGSGNIPSVQNSSKGSPKMEETNEHASSLDVGSGDISSDQCSSELSPRIEEANEYDSKLDIVSGDISSDQVSKDVGSADISSDQCFSELSPKVEETNEHASKLDIVSGDISSDQFFLKQPPQMEETHEHASSLDIGSIDISSDQKSSKESPKMEETNKNASSLNMCSGDISSDHNSTKGSLKMEETIVIDQSKIFAEKLDQLLNEQQSELNELMRKHEVAVSELFKELSPEIHQRVIDIHKQKVSDHKIQRRALLATNSFKASRSSLQKIIEGNYLTRQDSRGSSSSREDAYVPVLSYSLSSLKSRINSGMGIAVILRDDEEES